MSYVRCAALQGCLPVPMGTLPNRSAAVAPALTDHPLGNLASPDAPLQALPANDSGPPVPAPRCPDRPPTETADL